MQMLMNDKQDSVDKKVIVKMLKEDVLSLLSAKEWFPLFLLNKMHEI